VWADGNRAFPWGRARAICTRSIKLGGAFGGTEKTITRKELNRAETKAWKARKEVGRWGDRVVRKNRIKLYGGPEKKKKKKRGERKTKAHYLKRGEGK